MLVVHFRLLGFRNKLRYGANELTIFLICLYLLKTGIFTLDSKKPPHVTSNSKPISSTNFIDVVHWYKISPPFLCTKSLLNQRTQYRPNINKYNSLFIFRTFIFLNSTIYEILLVLNRYFYSTDQICLFFIPIYRKLVIFIDQFIQKNLMNPLYQ